MIAVRFWGIPGYDTIFFLSDGTIADPYAPKVFGYHLLSQEQVKLPTSNFVRTIIRSIATKVR